MYNDFCKSCPGFGASQYSKWHDNRRSIVAKCFPDTGWGTPANMYRDASFTGVAKTPSLIAALACYEQQTAGVRFA
jgi:hypothetical protein